MMAAPGHLRLARCRERDTRFFRANSAEVQRSALEGAADPKAALADGTLTHAETWTFQGARPFRTAVTLPFPVVEKTVL